VKVIVIGCGPAGLAAAHAAKGLGADVQILAPKKKTPQNGPLVVQRPIPGINTDHPDGTIRQVVIGGTILDYRYKLYGDINIGINGDILKPNYHAWRLPETYQTLWDMYQDSVTDYEVPPPHMIKLHQEADLVVSTANAERMCSNPRRHTFISKSVAISQQGSLAGQPDNVTFFSAGERPRWVRTSKLFGVCATEWRVEDAPPGCRIIHKPISTDCDCYPHILRTGRFGAYRNEVWIDSAYWDTYNAVDQIIHGEEIRKVTDLGRLYNMHGDC
jgi:hypothetical protein